MSKTAWAGSVAGRGAQCPGGNASHYTLWRAVRRAAVGHQNIKIKCWRREIVRTSLACSSQARCGRRQLIRRLNFAALLVGSQRVLADEQLVRGSLDVGWRFMTCRLRRHYEIEQMKTDGAVAGARPAHGITFDQNFS
jgi:hypothetical protein